MLASQTSTPRRILLLRIVALFAALLCVANISARSLYKPGAQLANNAVLSMYQDERGDMWIGTYDGLHLYNGKNTFVYRMELENDNSLCSNTISHISPAEKGYLWISTSLGINKFSLDQRCVVESYMQYVDAKQIAADSLGNTICFANNDFISCYRAGGAFFEDVYMPGFKAANMLALWSEGVGKFCAVSGDGELFRFRLETSTKLVLKLESRVNISEKPLRRARHQNGTVYFVDTSHRLWSRSIATSQLVELSDLALLGDLGQTTSMICTFGDDLFVGFLGGALGRVPLSGGVCELVGADYRIFCLWPDRNQDILWVGTDGYGVHMYCDKDEMFTTLLMEQLPRKVLKPVRAMFTDHCGDLWIGTKGGGVIRIGNYASYSGGDLDPLSVRYFDRRDGLASNEVFAFSPSVSGDLLWIGSSGPGLSYYSFADQRIRTLDRGVGMQDIRSVHQVVPINDSTLYIACDAQGLVELHLDDSPSPSIRAQFNYRFRMGKRDCNEFYDIHRESDSTLLLAMRGGYGLIRFNCRTKAYDFVDMHRLQSRALGDLLSLCNTSTGLYCGASSGLIRLSAQGDIRQFDRRNGILNDMVHGVLEDAHGCIWLSTNKGLTQYNPRHDFFYNYSASELQVFEFCDDAYWRCPQTNRLFFGGVNGVVWIDPVAKAPMRYKPDLRFINVEFSDGALLPLWQCGDSTSPVRIPPQTNSFTVWFVAADYLYGDNFEYSFNLEGANGGWTELQKSNKVTFIDLPSGKYQLQVRYKSNVMDRADRIYTLNLTVLPPWYRSSIAVVGYILLTLLAIWLLVRATRRHYRRKQLRVVSSLEEEQREKLSEARLNFFVNISHELCTPLTLINGMNERISRLGDSDPELGRLTRVMDENVRGLNELVQEILDFRKIEEAGFGRISIRRVDVAEILSAQLRSFTDAARQSGVELQLECSPSLNWNTDVAFLKKIFANLVSNAMKYTPVDGQIVITATAALDDDFMTLRVYNTGQGIAPDHLEGIFDRFRILDNMDRNAYSAAASRNGLGLFICRGLVNALGGQIAVRSQVGKFAEFEVRLPQCELTTEEPSLDRALATDTLETSRRNVKPTILVVDDNRDILWLIESALSANFNILGCSSVDQALSRLTEFTPDLIITDIAMPDRPGFDLINSVRNDKYLRGIPIVVVSARASESEQVEGLDVGADLYLTKPFSVPVLCASVESLLSNRRVLRDYFNTPESVYTTVEGQKMHQTERAFMDQVLAIIPEYIESENLRMELIAERLGLTARNFYRKFKKISGRTPSDFIKDYRFEYAARLLTSTDLTIQQIMYKVGISNKSYFYRAFQLKYGVKPKEYRSKS